MLDVTAADIYALNDEDLRTLVGLLCEAEARSHSVPTNSVTWGGDQNARDGGIDVRVSAPAGFASIGFPPRPNTGIQVKKTDFTPGLIPGEMRPSGTLRPSILDLVTKGGAYIIVSSGTDASDSAWKSRLAAMRAAVADVTGHEELLLDFYDRTRLATWVRNHPGLIAWVRQRCGRILSGWQPYASWALSPEGTHDAYLVDEKVRLHAGTADEKGVDLNTGIARIRDLLRNPKGVVRLVGLSGVGKTRLVQALFDSRTGLNALDPAIVLYTDINDDPTPQPTGMIANLAAARTRAIVVVDNCQPELHRRLTEMCKAPNSSVSIITIEYDVQDDEPEGTDVYKLEPSSVPLVAQLLGRRFTEMLRIDVDRIAEFSGGNARMALALANTLERNESVTGLRDEEMFKRLFHQRQVHDDSLLKAAQALALLYSFEGETLTGDAAELPKIGALIGLSGQQMYSKVAQLKQRDLVQRRGVWRAILPHAIANRLAKMALEEIPAGVILEQFTTERLLKSFTRRLSYLHESEVAVRIAMGWLEPGGYLGAVNDLNEFGKALLANIAPVAPDSVLAAIERAMASPDGALPKIYGLSSHFISTLHSIAYDAPLFERCAGILVAFALAEPAQNNHPATTTLKHLFHIFLSGTHSPVEKRAEIADGLLSSNNPAERELGRKLLDALLEANTYSASFSFDFGARVRDYGYWPKTREDRAHWFVKALGLARKHGRTGENAAFARARIASTIRAIWSLSPEVQQEIELFADEVGTAGYWHEGWIATRNALALPKQQDVEGIDRLRAFEARLQPKNIEQQVRAVVLTETWSAVDFANNDHVEDRDEDEAENIDDDNRALRPYERAGALAEELGKVVAHDEAVFNSLLADLVTSRAQRLVNFANGIATASPDFRAHWSQLSAAFERTAEEKRTTGALIGFLIGLNKRQPGLCETLLEDAVTHELFAAWFPILQTAVVITPAGADRLKRSLALGQAGLHLFRHLGWGRASDALSGADLRDILLGIAAKDGGFEIAIDILSMHFHSDKNEKVIATELIDCGRDLLSNANFVVRGQSFDYHLESVAEVCLATPEGAAGARALCEKIRQGFGDHTFRAYEYQRLLSFLFKLQPRIALDIFFPCSPVAQELELDVDGFQDIGDRSSNPFDGVPSFEILQWCDEAPARRYVALAKVVGFHAQIEKGPVEWTSIALEMLDRAPHPTAILEIFVQRFSPRSWSGSRAEIVKSRAGLLDRLPPTHAAAFVDAIARFKAQLEEDVARSRKWENQHDRERDERFE